MSWGNMFDSSGAFSGGFGGGNSGGQEDMGGGFAGGQSGFSGNKRSAFQHEGDQVFKKPRGGARDGGQGGFGGGQSAGGGGSGWGDADFSGPTSWDDMGSFRGSGNFDDGDDYGNDYGGVDDYGGDDSFGDDGGFGGGGGSGGGGGFGDLSEITSWDQIASGGQKGGGAKNRGKARGSSRGSPQRGGSNRGRGQFGGNKSGGGFSRNSSYDDDSWGDGRNFGGKSNFGGGGNFGGGNKGFGGGGGKSFGGGNRGGFGNRGGRGGGGGRGGHGGGGGRGGFNQGRGGGGFGGGGKASEMTLIEKFRKYIDFLKKDRVVRQNSIQSLENACMTTALGLKTNYFVEELPRIYNRQIFTGKVSINGIFLYRSVGTSKKEMKHEVFNKAHEFLLKASIDDINNLKDPGTDMVRASIEKVLRTSGPGKFSEGHGTPVNKAMPDIIADVKKNLDTIAILSTGLKKLTAYLKGTSQLPDNPVSMLEQSMIASKCGLRHIYQAESASGDEGLSFEGSFILEDTTIARGSDVSKKACKQQTYTAAIEALSHKSVTELVIPVEKDNKEADDEEHVQNEAIVTGVAQPDGEGPPPIAKPSLREAPAIDKWKHLVYVLSSTAFTDNNVSVIDNSVCNSGLSAMCIYKRLQVISEECGSCELFIDNVHVSTGLGANKSECMLDAYNNGWETLIYTEPQDILANHRRLAPNETTDPFVLEVTVKGGSGPNRESNIVSLKRMGFDPDDESKTVKDLVIYEASNWHEDRKTNAFCILQQSATLSGLLLQWSFTTQKPTTQRNYRNEQKPMSKIHCVLFVKGTKVGEHTAFGKNKTRNFAAADVLYRLYESQDVVRVAYLNLEEKCIEFEDIQREADALRRAARQPKPEPITDLLTERKADEFVVKAVSNRIDKKLLNPNGEDLVIGPGVPEMEIREIRLYALSKHLIFLIKQHQGKSYLVIQPTVDLKEIVASMKAGNGKFGKFKLVPKADCPKHADLNIKVNTNN